MIPHLVRRWASRTVQTAHARVTRENERYVREAIERDAEVERLTQERDRANSCLGELNDVLLATELEKARLERRWAMHADRCAVAQQLDDVDRDKALENQG